MYNIKNYEPRIKIQEEDPTPFMKGFQCSSSKALNIEQNMFYIEIEASCEADQNQNSLNLQLTFSTEVDQDCKYVVLQQEIGETQWSDITDNCTTRSGSPNFTIPVKKSARIWVSRFKDSLSGLIHSFRRFIHGEVLFHILVYHKASKKQNRREVRVIGISEELYQNRESLKTAVTIANEENFSKCKESEPKLLLKKGSLNVKFWKAENCEKSCEFDLGRSTLNTFAQWCDCTLDKRDSNKKLEVKVIDNEGQTLWCVDLNEILGVSIHTSYSFHNISQVAHS